MRDLLRSRYNCQTLRGDADRADGFSIRAEGAQTELMGDTFVTHPVTYRFLLDEDVKGLLPLFPPKRVKTTADLDLPTNASDAAIVKAAWRRGFTIVTANTRDFNREVEAFLTTGPKRRCRCLWGLVLLPSGTIQRQLLKRLRNLERRLQLDGKSVTWRDVQANHYRVTVYGDRSVKVSKLPRCAYHRKKDLEDET